MHSFWLFLPAGIANVAPIIANKIPLLNLWKTPLDFGMKFRDKPIFGKNKTWRGLVCGALLAAFAGIFVYIPANVTVSVNEFVVGAAAMGIGALLGDAVESFFKRQAHIAPGHSWFPFDQIDYIIGGLALSYPFLHPSLAQMGAVLIIYFGLHLIASYIGYLFGLKDSPI
jgi:CDP-2,3-bis-(O-geranylgeranyl)-sn-glycerol synthase